MKHRIAVLGAGYAGANAAGRLARRLQPADTEITVVNADPDFVERVRLHQLATGQELKHRPLADVFAGTGIVLKIARVATVDADAKTVLLEDGSDLAYDTLVYALGSTAADQGVPGVADHAENVAGKAGALRLRDRLTALPAGGTVLVTGGGLTGIEAVTEIAESRPDLDVALAVRGGLGDWLSEKGRRHLTRVMSRLGVRIHDHTDVTEITGTHALTADGRKIPAEITVWTAGFAAHPIAAATTLRTDPAGRVMVDASMRSLSHPDVYAIGDAALAQGAGDKPLRMSCASGIPMAWHAADTIAAHLTARPLPETTIGYTLQCISLGRHDALVQRVTPDDRAKPSALTGRPAARVKQLICTAAAWSTANPTLKLPTRRHPTR
ncbi:NAD(P)/FAD-dependent oxidoreductase [Actinocorallia longicatena]|uniref:FAD-dependent oxidoreductase n=1 Tax=Actinocorallia longicatena TaxID=111803 RepID=A0ABP6QEY6_9ACTN